jgi:hypothetical protein
MTNRITHAVAAVLRRIGSMVGLLSLALMLPGNWLVAQSIDDDLRWNEIQVIGTHNSYHLAPQRSLLEMIRLAAGKQVAESIDYSHAPLQQQLEEYGVRQFELDLFADPKGGLYREPVGLRWLNRSARDARMEFDFDAAMSEPGMKILHAPGFDFATTVPSLKEALGQLVAWSRTNRTHLPVLVLLELKESAVGPGGVTPLPFDAAMLDRLDRQIREEVPEDMLLTPDAVRGDQSCLRDAIDGIGWPRLAEIRGKLVFALDNTDSVRDRYLEGHESLRGRVLFVSVEASHPAAAWMKINDPVADELQIHRCVERGFLVRTRADAETLQPQQGDFSRMERAFASGAQFISTDFPVADARWPGYQVRFPGGSMHRRNPVALKRP